MSSVLESPTAMPPLGALEVRSASLSEQAYIRMRELILDRKISAGSTLLEGKIADELGISRTPMREALGRLAGEGLLVRRDARSYSVRSVGTKEYFDSMRTRELLECEAIALAINRIDEADLVSLAAEVDALNAGQHTETEHWHFDDRFHLFIAQASGNVVLPRLIQQLRDDSRLFRLHSPLHRQKENHHEHGEIIHALRKKDVEGAKGAMRAHLRSLQNDVQRVIMG
ncbi:DNA-binding GntR family transcriptional regulator [Rhodoferax ferrireducens]|uniref:DNA-binding GntR family transcriptional regulator n=1 Tax=Rhodoferax ferrireducens TaxID=192843 RepID=A0ABU2C5C9_9BURK|nr:GntR family transcriptional regulator [Rhodoferax ferrireducens]MDR7376530.1 DNA-binding GntR family transcriptional regulator [Rhodoferax ferrireducens]